MRYLFRNEILDAVLSATNGDSNYPVANLQDRFLQKRFQSTGEISQITSLLDATKDINCIAHGHTNATSIYSYLYGQGQFIGQAYTNLVQDPTDLTTGNWNKNGVDTPIDSGQTIEGEILWEIEATIAGTADNLSQNFLATDTEYSYTCIVRKGNGTGVSNAVYLKNVTTGVSTYVSINFLTQVLVTSNSIILDYEWIDSETVRLYIKADTTITIGDTLTYALFATFAVSEKGYGYFTMPQTVVGTTMFPFVNGTHPADVIDETFTMPDKFVVRLKINPMFAFDTTLYHLLFSTLLFAF